MPKHVTLDHSTASVNIQRIYPIDLTPEDNISVQEKSGTEQWIVVIISQPSCLRFDLVFTISHRKSNLRGKYVVLRHLHNPDPMDSLLLSYTECTRISYDYQTETPQDTA